MSLSSILVVSSFKFTIRWHSLAIFWKVNFEFISSLHSQNPEFYFCVLKVKDWTNIRHLNESKINSLNFSHFRMPTPAKVTKSSTSHFSRFRQFHRAFYNEVLYPKIFVSTPVDCSIFISPGCFGKIKLTYFSCSVVDSFLNNLSFFSSFQCEESFLKMLSYLLSYDWRVIPMSGL